MKSNLFRLLFAITVASSVSPLGAPAQQGAGAGRHDPNPRNRQLRVEPNPNNQALITFTLEPAVVYPNDRVTLRWSVRDRRQGVAWGDPVHIRSSFAVAPALPEPAPLSGSHSFVASEDTEHGRFTIGTGGALYYAEKTVEFRVEQTPAITRLTVEDSRGRFVVSGRGTPGQRVAIVGSGFGDRQGQSRVELTTGGQTIVMPAASWSDERIVVRVPNNSPGGEGSIRVSKGGGRLVSNQVQFTIFKSITINNAVLQAVVADLGLGQTQIHLNRGNNASSVTFSPAMVAAGAANRSFTVPSVEGRVPAGGRIAAHILIPFGGFPEKAKYYVNNVDSNRVTMSISGGQLVLTVSFESSGPEIKGELKYCETAVLGQCITDSWYDGLAPDVQVNNARVVVRFTPAASNGNLTLSSASADFDADFEVGGDWEDWLVDLVTRYRGQVKPVVNQALTATVNRAAVRNAISSALMSQLRGLGVNRVTSVSANGGSITVRFE
jgi:hypothetical protein